LFQSNKKLFVLSGSKDTFFLKNHSINLRGTLMALDIPRILGILNLTPDSFFDGGKYLEKSSIKARVTQMVEEGADIIDLGACSTRPGAIMPSEKEEINRLTLGAGIIRDLYPDIPLSVDTFRINTAQMMIEEFSACMVNDVSGGEFEPGIQELAAQTGTVYVLMHMQGTPETMQRNPQYNDVLPEILYYFSQKIDRLKQLGVNDYIIDPGFGFGKSLEHNYEILSKLEVFSLLDIPVMVGISRKSMISKVSGTGSTSSINGTTALHMYALMKGAQILRVHDIKEAKETINLFLKLKEKVTNPKIK
jgi:dihydropteroate synthase